MSGWLKSPDARVVKALARLRGDPDFMQVLAWLEHSVQELDRAKRVTADAVVLRMQQGAAKAVAEFVDHGNGVNKATAIAPRDTLSGPVGQRTP
ncbi:MAG: hypothetical protein OEW90_00890 [Betaproteobacteria bacterium]|nr:hypothetical protein [Betaproteobacteria bacterium]MDH4322673.1 hypothetical protein [Betaproteobacteria bacterium]